MWTLALAPQPLQTRTRAASEPREVLPQDNELFGRLKLLRRRLADRDGVPAYIVFSDRTLVEMAQRKPASPDQLLEVSGVGAAKLSRYGAAFLAEIAASR